MCLCGNYQPYSHFSARYKIVENVNPHRIKRFSTVFWLIFLKLPSKVCKFEQVLHGHQVLLDSERGRGIKNSNGNGNKNYVIFILFSLLSSRRKSSLHFSSLFIIKFVRTLLCFGFSCDCPSIYTTMLWWVWPPLRLQQKIGVRRNVPIFVFI